MTYQPLVQGNPRTFHVAMPATLGAVFTATVLTQVLAFRFKPTSDEEAYIIARNDGTTTWTIINIPTSDFSEVESYFPIMLKPGDSLHAKGVASETLTVTIMESVQRFTA